MIRLLRFLVVLLAGLGLAGLGLADAGSISVAAAETGSGATVTPTVRVTPIPLSEHCYYVRGLSGAAAAENQGFMSNAGFVITPAGVVVFDALGTPALARELVQQIRALTDRPIRRVVVSHFHADHVYGLQVFQDLGAEVWAHAAGRTYANSEAAAARLAQRRATLAPWVDGRTRLVGADRWLDGDTSFTLGGLHFELRHLGPAHSDEDLAMFVREDGVLYSGDLVFKGRVPFVGEADSRAWLTALGKLLALDPKVLVPGHGDASTTPAADLALTRDYLRDLRDLMGTAVADFVPFDAAYAAADWSKYDDLPAFEIANRANAYNTYLLLEREALMPERKTPED